MLTRASRPDWEPQSVVVAIDEADLRQSGGPARDPRDPGRGARKICARRTEGGGDRRDLLHDRGDPDDRGRAPGSRAARHAQPDPALRICREREMGRPAAAIRAVRPRRWGTWSGSRIADGVTRADSAGRDRRGDQQRWALSLEAFSAGARPADPNESPSTTCRSAMLTIPVPQRARTAPAADSLSAAGTSQSFPCWISTRTWPDIRGKAVFLGDNGSSRAATGPRESLR